MGKRGTEERARRRLVGAKRGTDPQVQSIATEDAGVTAEMLELPIGLVSPVGVRPGSGIKFLLGKVPRGRDATPGACSHPIQHCQYASCKESMN